MILCCTNYFCILTFIIKYHNIASIQMIQRINQILKYQLMENLENLFKKIVYTGVGFISYSTDKFNESVRNLIAENKISEQEGKEIISNFLKDAQEKKEIYNKELKELSVKILEQLQFARKVELEKLTQRLDDLEKELL